MKTSKYVAGSFLLFAAFCPFQAKAQSLGSLWNGSSFAMPGITLLQDASSANSFYWLPFRYKLETASRAIENEDGDVRWQNVPSMSHTILVDGRREKRSVYTFHVKLDGPSKIDLLKARNAIMNKFGGDAQIEGMAQICGMQAVLPTITGSAASEESNAGSVTLGFAATAPGDCTSTRGSDAFNIKVNVPYSAEPAMAESLNSGTGLSLPLVRLVHPYKYEDKASVHIKIKDVYDYMKNKPSIAGSIKFVQFALGAEIQKMMHQFQLTKTMTLDIQSKDPAVRARIEKVVSETIASTLFEFKPIAAPREGNASVPPIPTAPTPAPAPSKSEEAASSEKNAKPEEHASEDKAPADSNASDKPASEQPASEQPAQKEANAAPISSVISGDGSSGSSPALVSVSFGMDKNKIEDERSLDFSLNDVAYGTVSSDAEIYIPAIDKKYFAPEVQQLMRVKSE